jgi:hypothetical protein
LRRPSGHRLPPLLQLGGHRRLLWLFLRFLLLANLRYGGLNLRARRLLLGWLLRRVHDFDL